MSSSVSFSFRPPPSSCPVLAPAGVHLHLLPVRPFSPRRSGSSRPCSPSPLLHLLLLLLFLLVLVICFCRAALLIPSGSCLAVAPVNLPFCDYPISIDVVRASPFFSFFPPCRMRLRQGKTGTSTRVPRTWDPLGRSRSRSRNVPGLGSCCWCGAKARIRDALAARVVSGTRRPNFGSLSTRRYPIPKSTPKNSETLFFQAQEINNKYYRNISRFGQDLEHIKKSRQILSLMSAEGWLGHMTSI